MEDKNAKRLGYLTVAAAWLAVFCLFGFRSSFSILNPVMIESTGWEATLPSTGYSIMMTVYAITAFLCGAIIDKFSTRPAYLLGAFFCAAGFFLTSLVPNSMPMLYLLAYGVLAGVGTGMLWVSSTLRAEMVCRQIVRYLVGGLLLWARPWRRYCSACLSNPFSPAPTLALIAGG